MRWFDGYLKNVAEQIRVKRIRQPLMLELEDHLELQKAAYLDDGLTESEAEQLAIADMGDPLLVGGELDRVHRPKTQWNGIILSLFFIALGILLQVLLGNQGIINGKYMAFSLTAAGMLLLVSTVDYTFWMKLTFPVLGFWLLLWTKRFTDIVLGHFMLKMLSRMPDLYYSAAGLNGLLSTLIPECICVAAPLLTAFMVCRLRGRRWGAFAACVSVPLLTAALSRAYRQTAYNSNAMMLTALCGFAVLFIAVRFGFFQIRRKTGYLVLTLMCVLPALMFISGFISRLQFEQSEYKAALSRLLCASHLLGSGTPVENLSEWIPEYPGAAEIFLALLIHRFGWIPFILFTIVIVGLLLRLLICFLHMKNRMGALLGLSSVLTLAVQCTVYYLYSFTNYTHLLCLPLISYGNAMLIIDAILAGVILSALRGQDLPEPAPLHPRSA